MEFLITTIYGNNLSNSLICVYTQIECDVCDRERIRDTFRAVLKKKKNTV